MASVKRNKKRTDDLLDKMCGKEAVAEKFKSDISAKVKNIPQDESNEEEKKQAVVEEQILVDKNSLKSQFNSNEKKQIADNIVKSVMSYKDEQEKILSEKEKGKEKTQPETDNKDDVYLAYNYPLPEGTVIDGRYKLQGKPRQGGFGMTYLATRVGENDGEFVVIKELYPYNAQRNVKTGKVQINYNQQEGQELLKNFKKEAARIETLKKEKPHEVRDMNLVITKTEAFEFNGNWYYVMEYVPGNSLHHIMQSFENDDDAFAVLPYKSRFRIMDQLCNALYHLHDINCVHQDISPNNMMVSFDTEGEPNLKVIDFGLATGLNHQNESSISFVNKYGTKGFCDSQNLLDDIYVDLQKNGQGDKLKLLDVYSLGAVLGYLFLEDIKSIKESNFGEKYNIRLQNMRPKQDLIFDENDSLEFKALKSQLFLIHNLVCQATVKNLDERIKSVESFRTYLNLIEKIDANFIQNLETDLGSLVDNREGDSDDINTGGQGVNNAGKDDVVKVTENEDKKSDKEPYKPSGIKSLFNKIKTKWNVIFSVLVVGLVMVFVITRPESPITIEYLNEVFIAAQHNDSAAKQRIKEIIDDKVRINYIEGETLFYTYDLSTFLTKGNNAYIIGKTHKINRFKTGPDGKVITIVLEELN